MSTVALSCYDRNLAMSDFDEDFERRLDRLEHLRQADLMREMGLYQQPLRDAASVQALVDFELSRWSQEERDLIAPYLLGTPHFHVREWDYAGLDTPPRELYLPCWTVAYFPSKELSLVYCVRGHGSHWGALKQDGWCGTDAVWRSSMKESIWFSSMVDGFGPGDQNLASWMGPAWSLTSEELEDINALAVSSAKDPSALGDRLERVWAHYILRGENNYWDPARYMYEILTFVLSKAPPEVREKWDDRVKARPPE